MVDLHVHTTFSDGQYTPTQIIKMAVALKMKAIAITDHDSTAGVNEAKKAVKSIKVKISNTKATNNIDNTNNITSNFNAALTSSNNCDNCVDAILPAPNNTDTFSDTIPVSSNNCDYNIILIPGIELNIDWLAGECHLLGLGLKNTSLKLQSVINNLRQMRIERNEEVIQKLRDNGIDITLSDVVKEINSEREIPADLISRVHIASYLVTHKYTHSKKIAFEKYLANNALCYVRKRGVDMESGIAAIKESGGIPVIAHPMSMYLSRTKLKNKLEEFFSMGVMGLEAYHPSTKPGDCYWLEETAHKIGYFITAGSDFHGESVRSDRKLGYTMGDAEIDNKYYFNELLPALNKIQVTQ